MRPRRRSTVIAAVVLLALTGCAASPGSRAPSSTSDAAAAAPLGEQTPAPPAGEVVGAGHVMDVGGDVQLCLGAIMDSYPPQCGDVPLDGWSWDGVEGSESSGDVRWGAYAVTGIYDGSRFTATRPPVLLALYDPPALEDPTGGEPGTASEDELIAIQGELMDRDIPGYLGSGPQNGRLWIDVVWDDGTLQDAAAAEFGEDVVIRSALREAE